jgi:DNA-directed RNA polymerase subunit RPC12/RpoP
MANEKRLIDANTIPYEEHYVPDPDSDKQWDYKKELCVLKSVIDQMHTVDAVEVVHGEWEVIEDDYFDLVEMKCSVCGASYGFEDYEDDTPKNYHYCPLCGAKMDK